MKNRTIVFLLATIILISFFTSSKTSAMLGPVHVELNTTQEKFGAARANSVTAFVIYFRINVNIEVHDWVKVWFPTNEASWDLDDVCDGLPEIKGEGLEHPRFIPNEKYFEIYKNQEEFEIGKLYEILNEHDVDTDFYEPTNCEELSENCRLRPDHASGLGYWLHGNSNAISTKKTNQTGKKERHR
ncbi:MAG: hypothetical protein R2883_01485 [Caldisericia bacterium]